MNLLTSLQKLLALGREVAFSGELDATPPGGRHLAEFLDAHDAFLCAARSGIRTRPDGFRFLACVVVDVKNQLCSLRTWEDIAGLMPRSCEPSKAATGVCEILRTEFRSALDYLEDIEAPLELLSRMAR